MRLFFSPSDSGWYRNIQQIFIYLYPATLLNSFIPTLCVCVCVQSLGFSICNIMSSANSDSFTSSFLILLPLLYFSCLVALARFSRTILNKSGDSGLPNLVPNLREKAFSVSAPSLKLVVGLSYMTFIMMMFILSIPSLLLRVFYHERMLKFVKCFFCVY